MDHKALRKYIEVAWNVLGRDPVLPRPGYKVGIPGPQGYSDWLVGVVSTQLKRIRLLGGSAQEHVIFCEFPNPNVNSLPLIGPEEGLIRMRVS